MISFNKMKCNIVIHLTINKHYYFKILIFFIIIMFNKISQRDFIWLNFIFYYHQHTSI
jgi:hypothetical protein